MNGVIPSDIPYILGFILVAAFGFWAIGRAADRGALAGPRDKVFPWLGACYCGTAAVWTAVDREWLRAAVPAIITFLFLVSALRRRRDGPRRAAQGAAGDRT